MKVNKQKLEESKKRKNQRGQTMTEYAIIVAMIALIAIGAIKFIGEQSKETFQNIGNELQEANENYDSTE